jgi:hypothetical protein
MPVDRSGVPARAQFCSSVESCGDHLCLVASQRRSGTVPKSRARRDSCFLLSDRCYLLSLAAH